MDEQQKSSKKPRRGRGDDSITWDKINKCYVGRIALGCDENGKRLSRSVQGRTKTEVKDKLKILHDEIAAGIRTPATYNVRQCVEDWLDSLTLDAETVSQYRGQAMKWIYPRIGKTKLRDFKATDADQFFKTIAAQLSKRSLVMIKSTLRRSIRRAQVMDLIGKNVAELVDLPDSQPGRPSRAMTEVQAGQVLRTASGQGEAFTRAVRVGKDRHAATHAASKNGTLACRNKARTDAQALMVSDDLSAVTCRSCRSQLKLYESEDAALRLQALFVLAITLGLRPGELRRLTWDLVDLDVGVIHVWRSASRSGDVKTPKSKRSLELPRLAITALKGHKQRQATERSAAGELWEDNNLVFCHENGAMYTRDALNWRFSRMTKRAGIGHWHAHEGRHTAVSIMSSNGVPIQDISDTVGHRSTHVTETVYRHVIVPAVRGGASVMDSVFSDQTR